MASTPTESTFFDIRELFISRTDRRGIIEFGNNVFVRVSEYSREQLLGSPHNLVRHPDIPKCLFRNLWSSLKEDRLCALYIKNRTSTGKAYWVFATVFPAPEGGYLSIRIKPTSPLFEKIQKIYGEVLVYEREHGVDSALEHFLTLLKKEGFNSYNAFMSEALRQEMQLRDRATRALATGRSRETLGGQYQHFFHEIQNSVGGASHQLLEAWNNLIRVATMEENSFQTSTITEVFAKLECLSVNMSVVAHRLGKEGGTLSIVANMFQLTASQVLQKYDSFQKNLAQFHEQLEASIFSIGCSKLQAEMLSFFVGECLSEAGDEKILKRNVLETGLMIQNVKSLFEKNKSDQMKFHEILFQLRKDVAALHGLVVRLDLIKVGGKLEGSRSSFISDTFQPFVKEMDRFVKTVSDPVSDMLATIDRLVMAYDKVMKGLQHIDFAINESVFVYDILKGNLGRSEETAA